MIADKDTDFVYFSDLLRTDPRYTMTCIEISKILTINSVKHGFLPATNDIWARDYMPTQISEDKFVEFRYDPDYLQGSKKGFRNLKTYPDIVFDAIGRKAKKSNIILDGGNVVKSKNCVILTDKIIEENRYIYSKTDLIKTLYKLFEVDKVVIIPKDTHKDDHYGHADGMIRFIDNETVLLNSHFRYLPGLIETLQLSLLKFEFLRYDLKNTNRRNWCYLNFLQTKDIIFVPKINIEEDAMAFQQLKEFFPDYSRKGMIFQIELEQVVKRGGALNCISWTMQE